jgi:CHAD domain-containing protein
MPTYPPELLRRSTGEATRAVIAACLDDAVAARARLATEDAEALHDFRVAVRRLRSHLRAFAPGLPLAASWRPRLKALQVATNRGRDLEVQLEWVLRARARLPRGRQRIGVDALTLRLTRDRSRAVLSGLRCIQAECPALERELERFLAQPAPPAADCYAALVGELGLELDRKLRKRLADVSSLAQVHEPHAARIAAKRLRYLLETVAGAVRPAATLVKRLKELQDLLGDLHDLQLMARRLDRLGRRQDHRQHGEAAGVAALQHRAERQARRLFRRLEREWLSSDASAKLATRAKRVNERLAI